MLVFEDILNAQKLRRMAGQFPTGHYDHDARLAIGPPCVLHGDQLSQVAVVVTEEPTQVASDCGDILQLSVSLDPHTGEPLFELRK